MPYGVTGYVIIRRTAEPGQAGEDRLTSVQMGGIYNLCCASCAAAASLWRWVVRRRDLKVLRALSGTLAI